MNATTNFRRSSHSAVVAMFQENLAHQLLKLDVRKRPRSGRLMAAAPIAPNPLHRGDE
jgi:hypothetical protein